jgi:PAS domain-containing protein
MRIAVTEMSQEVLLRQLLDAMPSFVFVVDRDVSILDYNAAAGALLRKGREHVLHRRAGDVLHCLHSTDAAEGCGRGYFCKTCLVRASVKEAFEGRRSVRRRVRMELVAEGKTNALDILLTASPFSYRGHEMAVLVLEDLGSIGELRLSPAKPSRRRLR